MPDSFGPKPLATHSDLENAMISVIILAIGLAAAPGVQCLTLSFNGRVNGSQADGSFEFPLTLSWGASSVTTYFKGPNIQVRYSATME